MHLTRAKSTTKLPIARKGTKYVARPFSHIYDSITVLAAIRDILKLGKNAREVNEMIKGKLIKINERIVNDYHQPICLLNILHADKSYKLTISPAGRFVLEETKDKTRIAKIIGKKVLNKSVTQLNLHDGTNIIFKEDAKVGDSLELDFENKIKKVISFGKGKKVFVKSGRNMGNMGIVSSVEGNNVKIKLEEKEVVLNKEQLIVL